ncbi:MAG: hypothetical protein IH846_13720 [Acidobacteria bacterium]|nr:hypothetical protein [Acidobacteriota bacterium]
MSQGVECPKCGAVADKAKGKVYCPSCGWNRDAARKHLINEIPIMAVGSVFVAALLVIFAWFLNFGDDNPPVIVFFVNIFVLLAAILIGNGGLSIRRDLSALKKLRATYPPTLVIHSRAAIQAIAFW